MAQALGIYPGRTNMAMFLVGDRGRKDAYAFELVGLNPDWKAMLYDATTNKNLVTNLAEIAGAKAAKGFEDLIRLRATRQARDGSVRGGAV